MIRDVALVGAGYWGKNLMRVLHELGRLGLVYDRDPAVENAIPDPEAVGFSVDFDIVVENDDITAVVIAAPTEIHFSLAK